MKVEIDLDGFDMPSATLENEWVITVDTPSGGVDAVLGALEREMSLYRDRTTVVPMYEKTATSGFALWKAPTPAPKVLYSKRRPPKLSSPYRLIQNC